MNFFFSVGSINVFFLLKYYCNIYQCLWNIISFWVTTSVVLDIISIIHLVYYFMIVKVLYEMLFLCYLYDLDFNFVLLNQATSFDALCYTLLNIHWIQDICMYFCCKRYINWFILRTFRWSISRKTLPWINLR